LSKGLATADANKIQHRGSDFYDEYAINFQLGCEVKSIDKVGKTVKLSNGGVLAYDKLCLATGGAARKPKFPGSDLKGVYTLRNAADQTAIKAEIQNAKSIVVVGSGFVGHEVAANLASTFKGAKEVHMISKHNVPLQKVLGYEIGQMI